MPFLNTNGPPDNLLNTQLSVSEVRELNGLPEAVPLSPLCTVFSIADQLMVWQRDMAHFGTLAPFRYTC